MTGAEVLHAHENKFLGVYGVEDRKSVLFLRGRDAIFPAPLKTFYPFALLLNMKEMVLCVVSCYFFQGPFSAYLG